MTEIYIGSDGFVYADGMRLPLRVDMQNAMLEFCDKDKLRSAARGTRFVNVDVADFATLLLAAFVVSLDADSSSSTQDDLTLLRG